MTKSSVTRRIRHKDKPQTVTRELVAGTVMSYDKARVKGPFSAPPIFDHFCAWIGKVAVTWGLLESRLDDLIAALLKETGGSEPKGWRYDAFRKRKEFCKDKAKIAFAANPAISDVLANILGTAADLHSKRNTLLKGALTCKAEVVGSEIDSMKMKTTIKATSKKMMLILDERGVEDLFYRIANLAGQLEQFMTPNAAVPTLSSDDTSRLRDFLVANHPNPATPPTRQPQP